MLASGELVESSRTKNADLFWALRGAGHNFGIVTSLEVKTYDIPSNWTVYSLIFPANKVEALFSLVNRFEEPTRKRPSKLVLTGVFIRIPAIDPINVSGISCRCGIFTNICPACCIIHCCL